MPGHLDSLASPCGRIKHQVKLMNTIMYFYRTHLQCNQSEPLADASGRTLDRMNENVLALAFRPKIIARHVEVAAFLG